MEIKRAEIDDIEAIRILVNSLSHVYLSESNSTLPDWFSLTLSNTEFKKRISSLEFSNFVAVIDGKIVAFIALKNKCHLYHLFVSIDYQRKGVARKLWQTAISESDCNVFTVRSSINAIPVYKKFGFVESGLPAEKDGIKYQQMEYCL